MPKLKLAEHTTTLRVIVPVTLKDWLAREAQARVTTSSELLRQGVYHYLGNYAITPPPEADNDDRDE